MPMFSLGHSILLRYIRIGNKMNNSFCSQELLKCTIHIFTTTIILKIIYFSLKVIHNKVIKFLEHKKHLRFIHQRKYPCKPCIFINKTNIVFIPFHWNNWTWSPNITTYSFKWIYNGVSTKSEHLFWHLATKTKLTNMLDNIKFLQNLRVGKHTA